MEENFEDKVNREADEILGKSIKNIDKLLSDSLMLRDKEEMKIALKKIDTTRLYRILKNAEEQECYEVCQAITEILSERVRPDIK